MGKPVISVEHLSKSYRLGQIGTGTFTNDLKLWMAKMRGKPNPLARIGETDHGNRDGEDLWALKDVSFTVEQGEVLGIIGRNGAGKSTLLKILSRVTAPTSGRIRVKGRVASLLEVGTGFHPELTGRENIYLNGAILGMNRKEINGKFDEIVDFAEIEKFIDTPVKRYSSGMYVRLAFAVAAHLEPEILIVDEVLAVGDAEFQKKCLGKMGDVAKEGRTVLFVSHNMPAVRTLCTRAILLDKGFINCTGQVDQVVDTYLYASSATLVNGVVPESFSRIGTGDVKIQSVRLTDVLGNAKPQVYMKETLDVNLVLDVRKDVNDAVLEIGVTTHDDIKVVQTLSTYGSEAPFVWNKGKYNVNVEIEITLMPGQYSLWVSTYHIGGVYMDLIERIFDFTVVRSSKDGKEYYRYPTRGFVRADARWQIQAIDVVG